MVGQIWFDKQDTRLKVYDGVNFRAYDAIVIVRPVI